MKVNDDEKTNREFKNVLNSSLLGSKDAWKMIFRFICGCMNNLLVNDQRLLSLRYNW